MKARFKLGMVIGFDNDHGMVLGKIGSISMTSEGISYGIDGIGHIEEGQISAVYKELQMKKATRKRRAKDTSPIEAPVMN